VTDIKLSWRCWHHCQHIPVGSH